ncbi:MAG: hypothetical protein R3338_09235, partial [Thermoanaerobaculia bacterium]|nr:hypothetical protein [Thermoanaerobaculia bacterium]
SVGRAVVINEGGDSSPQPSPTRVFAASRLETAEAGVGRVPVRPGTEDKRFTVSVVFELE